MGVEMSKEELDATDVLMRALFRLRDQGVDVAGDIAERMLALVDDLQAAGLLDDKPDEPASPEP